jgi:hypothetical protein
MLGVPGVRTILGSIVCIFLLCSAGECASGWVTASVETLMDRSLAADTWSSSDSSVSTRKPAVSTGHRSLVKAGLLSALVPGCGQYYNGRRQKARYFLAAEALAWIGFASFHSYGDWRKDDFIRFAAVRANAKLQGKSDEFADIVGFYDDIDQYNSLGRAFDPERPYLQDTPDNHWRWQSDGDRQEYRDLKNRSRESYRRSEFMIGLAVINRIVSVIDAVRDAARANRRIDPGFSIERQSGVKLTVDPWSLRRQVCLTLYSDF